MSLILNNWPQAFNHHTPFCHMLCDVASVCAVRNLVASRAYRVLMCFQFENEMISQMDWLPMFTIVLACFQFENEMISQIDRLPMFTIDLVCFQFENEMISQIDWLPMFTIDF